MSDKRFVLDKLYYPIMTPIEKISVGRNYMTYGEVVGCLNEQQATIRKLQDLCGESDGENAKLRIENKSLKDDLHNCRINKNIISEKLKMWQDVHKEYDIYSIKDFEELMKNVK